jgi:hypothetical protein
LRSRLLQYRDEFWAQGRRAFYNLFWTAVYAAPTYVIAHFGFRVAAAAALFCSIIGAFAIQQFNWNAKQNGINDKLLRMQQMLARLAITSEDILLEAAEADAIAQPMENSFRTAAERRAWETGQIEQHGSRTAVHQLTYSGTFEDVAKRNLPHWQRQFDDLSTKLYTYGCTVFVPSQPRTPIEGEPSADAIKLMCQREALAVAADALRRSVESSASEALQ